MDVKVADAGGDTMDLVDISGYRICSFGRTAEELMTAFKNIPNIECREDDIFILAPIKSGWSFLCKVELQLLEHLWDHGNLF